MTSHDELLARLDTFPAFFSMDGAHWYKSDKVDETCAQAAAAIRALQEDLAVYKNVVNDCGEGAVKQIRDLTAKLEAERTGWRYKFRDRAALDAFLATEKIK